MTTKEIIISFYHLAFIMIGLTICLCGCCALNQTSGNSQVYENQESTEVRETENAAGLCDESNFEEFGPIEADHKYAMEQTVSSPDGLARKLPAEDDMDYRLEVLRLPKWEWQNCEDGTIAYRGKYYRRNTYVKAILCLGIDKVAVWDTQNRKADRGVSDGIFLVAYDQARGKIQILMIPRDTITEIYQYYDNGQFQGQYLNHIGVAYSQLADPVEGCYNTIGAVSELFCGLEIDYYMAIGLDVIGMVTDMVDGVDVTVPNDQLKIANPDWTKGTKLHLTGENAETFVRFRNSAKESEDNTAILRMDQHKEYLLGFYAALKNKLKKDSSSINYLYDVLQEESVTDLSKGELIKLVSEAMSMNFGSDNIQNIPGEAEYRDYMEYYVDYENLIPIILGLFYREI